MTENLSHDVAVTGCDPAVTVLQTFDRALSKVVFAGSLVPMEKLPSRMEKAVIIRDICRAAQPQADVMKVMLLAEPVHVQPEVWLWRRKVLFSQGPSCTRQWKKTCKIVLGPTKLHC